MAASIVSDRPRSAICGTWWRRDARRRRLSHPAGKLEQERETLGGEVFDVLGQAIDGVELRRLMIEAIRYGDRPDVRAQLQQVVEGALDRPRLQALIAEHALTHEVMDAGQVYAIRQVMERMEAQRLQPHFIASFFKAAFAHAGGTIAGARTGAVSDQPRPGRCCASVTARS